MVFTHKKAQEGLTMVVGRTEKRTGLRREEMFEGRKEENTALCKGRISVLMKVVNMQ